MRIAAQQRAAANMTEALQAARPHHHETLVTQFHDEFVTPVRAER